MSRFISSLIVAPALLIVSSVTPSSPTSATLAYAASELTLLSPDGTATTYIAPDEEYTIYLWDGTPAAYLAPNDSTSVHVYSFDGAHTGWLEGGVVWDHDGNAIAALKSAFSGVPAIEPIKGIKGIKPIRGIPEIQPLKPLYRNTWAQVTLAVLLQLRQF